MGMMAQPLPPVPKSMSGQPDMESPPLAQAPQESQGNDVKDKAQTIMRQLMDMRRANESMAAQYPPAAKDFQTANEAIKAAMLKIVREIQQTPGSNPAPPVGPG
jgi:hypothetical protein